MSQAELDPTMSAGRFAVAQVALYVLSILQIVAALATATMVLPLSIAAESSTMQRASITTSAVTNILCFAVAYMLLARCLDRCIKQVWCIALAVFLVNAGAAVLAIMAQPNNLTQVLTCGLAVAGAASVLRGRRVA